MEVLRTRLCEWKPVGIDALALAPAGAPQPRLALARSNGAVELWDTSTWHLHSALPGCDKFNVRGFCWVPGASAKEPCRLLSAGLHREITEWDVCSLRPMAAVSSGGGAVWSLCILGSDLCAACDDGSLRLFSLAGGPGSVDYSHKVSVGKARVMSVCSTDTSSIFAGGSDSRITKWSGATRTCEASMTVEQAKDKQTLIWALTAAGSDMVASGDSLGLVHIWDAVACVCLHRFRQHQADVLCLAASPDSGVLLAGGVDAKVSTFAYVPGAEERWVFRNSAFVHTHDVRALAVDKHDGHFVSGGVSGKLLVHGLRLAASRKAVAQPPGSARRWGRPVECSGFSPVFQVASVAQDSRLLLCQRDAHLEVWYLGKPELAKARPEAQAPPSGSDGREGVLMVASESMAPDAQLLVSMSLKGPQEALHLSASAISPDGSLVAASDMNGTRLFHLDLAELQVRAEGKLPKEIRQTPARALLFCGPDSAPLLAMAAWSGGKVLLLDAKRMEVVATIAEHDAPVSHLAATKEWLASADTSGAAHVFSLDSMLPHTRVPAGSAEGRTTALAFDARGRNLVLALSTHRIVAFDVEEQAFAAGFAVTPRVPDRILAPHARICGIAAPRGAPHRLLLWGHSFVLSLEVKPWMLAGAEGQSCGAAGTRVVEGSCAWRRLPPMRHLLGFCALDEATWGPSLLRGQPMLTEEGQPPGKKRRTGAEVSSMVVTLEVAPEAAQAALPVAFERKRYHAASAHGGGQREATGAGEQQDGGRRT
ncbi:unnamed protein product [Prorocentrum cordatum]|uniref:Intraflagellar transport protein 122 homolog n=1 Tax=Prorocentrum cordatum TaxID=2364126 RepID=A0ABN9U1S6_9DINO|nr:unnamed protein product [Polarella glacialis]